MRMMMEDPTWPTVHGFGIEADKKPQQNLRLMGRIAAVMIAKGHSSQESTDVAEKLIQFQSTQLRSVLNAKDQVAYHTILESCIRHQIPVQQMTKTQAVARLQNFWRTKWGSRKTKASQQKVDPMQIQWIPRTFMIRNGQYVDVQKEWSPMTKGLAISSPKELEPYLMKGKLLSTEVSTALTCEPIQAKSPIQVTQIEIGVKDNHGNHALIQAWLTSFGQTPVVMAPTKNAEVEVETFTTLYFSVQQYHVEETWWKQLQLNPAKFLLQQAFQRTEQPKFNRIWSRRWSMGNRPVEQQFADSFSVLGSVLSSEVEDILRISGTQKPPIFISIHANKDAEPQEKWGGHRVIWVGREIEQALSSMSVLDEHRGLVPRHPSSYGIRVSESRFPEAYKELKQEDAPAVVKCKHRYVLENVPMSVDSAKLEAWAKSVDWPVRVLRRHNNGRFVVGVADHPSVTQFSINSVPILHTLVQDAPKDVKPILAGKLIMQVDPASSTDGVDPIQVNDPWMHASFQGSRKPNPGSCNAWENYRPNQGPSNMMTPANQVSATPSDDAMKAQSQRMSSIEADLANIKQQMETTQQANEGKFARIHTDIQNMHTSLRSSLGTALHDQSSQLNRTFEALMKGSPRNGAPKPVLVIDLPPSKS